MPHGSGDDDSQNHDLFFHKIKYGTVGLIDSLIHNKIKGIIQHVKVDITWQAGATRGDIYDFSIGVGTFRDLHFLIIGQMNETNPSRGGDAIAFIETVSTTTIRVNLVLGNAGGVPMVIECDLLFIGVLA